jgi:hypothetical protein
MPVCILEKEREHIGSIWSSVTCLALLLAAAQSLEHQAPRDSLILRRLTIVIRNKQINKQYTTQFLMTKQTLPKYATHHYEHMSTSITQIGATVKKL